MVRAKGPRSTILITDATAAAASPAGEYTIGGVTAVLGSDGRVSLPGTPYLAGSALTMDRAIANAARFAGLPIEEAAAMASSVPAAYLGTHTTGRIVAEWDPQAHELRVVA
jgi:N-acetylglucosamine-6-phosphate deacetylase